MAQIVLIAHAEGDESYAEEFEGPLRDAGYDVWHLGMVRVGESPTEEVSKLLNAGAPVVLCGTVKAIGTPWAHRLVQAARKINQNISIFPVKMQQEAYIEMLSLESAVAHYWQDSAKAIQDLLASLRRYFPPSPDSTSPHISHRAEQRYREIALASCDIIDLANLPENDRHVATRQLELRRLYVALRVQVEVASGIEVSEEKIKAIESRSDALRGQRSWKNPSTIRQNETRKRLPVGHRLAEARRLVILGEPGAGKTTMIRWLATAYLLRLTRNLEWSELPDVDTLPNENWLPIIVRCREFDQSNPPNSLHSLLRHILQRSEILEGDIPALSSALTDKLNLGEALLLVDGLDEITDPTLRAQFCQQLENIHTAYPLAPIVITSRIVGYREMGYRMGRGFEHLTVAELSPEDKDDFARRWCALTELPERRDVATTELIHDIHSTDRIERLTSNPMLLTTMALVKRKIGRLPTRRADLYGDALQVLLNWRRDPYEPIEWREALPQLEYLAYTMCDLGVLQLREDQVINSFDRIRQEYPSIHTLHLHTSESFLRLLERRTGILVQSGNIRYQGVSTSMYEFRHLTFQEYLAARALVNKRIPNRDRTKSLPEYVAPLAGRMSEVEGANEDKTEAMVSENWQEALRLAVAICDDDDVDNVLRAILNPLENEDVNLIQRPRAVLAALCLADEPNASSDTASEVLQKLVKAINSKDGSGHRGTSLDAAIKELATTRYNNSVRSALLQEFCSRDALTRWSVGSLAGVAATLSLPEQESSLISFLRDQETRLSSNIEEEAIEAALSISELAYAQKAYALPTVVEGLFKMLTRSAPATHAAAEALMRLNKWEMMGERWRFTARELETIITFIENPSSDIGAVKFLIRILGQEHDERGLAVLLTKLEDENESVRSAAINALGQIGSLGTVEALLAKFKNEQSSVRKDIIEALGKIQAPSAVEMLLSCLNDEETSLQMSAIEALGSIGDVRAIEPLINKLNDENREVGKKAAQALSKIKVSSHIEYFLRMLSSEDGDTKYLATEVLRGLTDPRLVAPMISKLSDDDTKVRANACHILGRIADIKALDPLLEALQDNNSEVRQSAALALGRIKDARAVQPLLKLFESDDIAEQLAAGSALGSIKGQEAANGLIAKVTDKKFPFRVLLTLLLGDLEDTGAVEVLLSVLEDEDAGVRQSAAYALGKLKETHAIERLIAKLSDEYSDVRCAAATALGQIGNKAAVESLIGALDDISASVRFDAVIALGSLKDVRALEPLLALVDKDNAAISAAAADAIAAINAAKAERALLDRLRSKDSRIKQAAISGLYDLLLEKVASDDLTGAINILENIIKVRPTDDDKNNLVFCLLRLGRYDRAEEVCNTMKFSTQDKRWPLWMNNRGLLSYLSGNKEIGENQLKNALTWITAAGRSYDPTDVVSVLLLSGSKSVTAHEGITVDAALLLNLLHMEGISSEEVMATLSQRYPSKYEDWLRLAGIN